MTFPGPIEKLLELMAGSVIAVKVSEATQYPSLCKDRSGLLHIAATTTIHSLLKVNSLVINEISLTYNLIAVRGSLGAVTT